jgi:hypothetical protein
MSQAAPPSDQAGKKATSPLVPPDERFWQRYSPHAEFPLSSAGSLVVHVLVLGLLGLMAWLGAMLFDQSNRKLPVEAVRLIPGGGGLRQGVGTAPGTGTPPQEIGEQPKEQTPTDLPPADVPDKIDVQPNPQVKPKFEEPTGRRIQQTDAASSSIFHKLTQTASRIQVPGSEAGPPSYGQGGPGSGGGSGGGKGTGIGPGSGPGTAANLTQREKRQIRWVMGFRTNNSDDYVAQLHGLGAILAIPVAERGDDFDYKIVRNLSAKPAKLLDEDVNQIGGMIKWFDKNPKSVVGVLTVLRIPVPRIPENSLHFFACMPAELEQKLLQLELAYLHKRNPKLTENDIIETKFELRVRGRKYEPEVRSQQVR